MIVQNSAITRTGLTDISFTLPDGQIEDIVAQFEIFYCLFI